MREIISKCRPTWQSLCGVVVVVFFAQPTLACAPPLPQCTLSNGQVATLYSAEGQTVFFEQHDPKTAAYDPTLVLVDCRHRQAVALGDLLDDTDDAAYAAWREGRRLMSDEVQTGNRPRLGKVYRALKGQGLRTKRFTLQKTHCGCALPDTPPPRANCPQEW